MGCGLPKLEKSDKNSPGKIYSTLKRPQVETKVDTAYEYKLLDFTIAAEGEVESSAVKLSSLRDLPDHLQELYQKGFVLAGFHPFIQSIDGQKKTPLEKIFRAILIKAAVSSKENNVKTEPNSLEMELCLLANQPVNSEGLADVLQKVQEKSKKGFRFVGHVLYQSSTANSVERPEERSAADNILNQNKEKKNEQSNINGDKLAWSQDAKGPPGEGSQSEAQVIECQEKADNQPMAKITSQEYQEDERQILHKSAAGGEVEDNVTDKQEASSPAEASELEAVDSLHTVGTAVEEQSPTATNEFAEGKPITEHQEANEASLSEANDSKQEERRNQGTAEGITQRNVVENEIFLLFNKQRENQKSCKYYTVTIPLKISKKGQDISSLEADWLDHMTEHFTKGALLVDALVCLGTPTDSIPKSVDGLFIFEGVSEEKYEMYDAIVVEQWTVINGNEVKTDYVPLLNSLAAYGWQLTCVLPTPIVRRDSDGNLATKQIVFLQRPSLPCKEKKKEPKKKSTKDDKSSKKDKNCLKDKNGKVRLQVKNSTGVSNEKENLEQSVAKNGDKENAENGISLKTEENEKSIPATEGVQNYICVTSAEVAGNAGVNAASENVINKACGNKNICENVDMKEVQEKHENECQNDTISRSEEKASQAKCNTPVNGEYTVTSQHLDNLPASEMPAQALEETTGSITEKNGNAPEEGEGVVEVQDGASASSE
ncbi:raftlin-like [Pristis pectinata]|uniref:raftlin-like n=1 Tax=Pristis pectinata TaxID=685728 RepID=UPI00223D81C4|nr:raftlin-like [Pristis pectinata]